MLWWIVVLFVGAAIFYAYSVSASIKIAPKGECASCPQKFAQERGF
jgi:hypothetical protein